MSEPNRYPGIRDDHFAGMTDIGRLIRDAWVFGILPEAETCQGWERAQFDALSVQVDQAWEPYGHLASRLPQELRIRHERIYAEAVQLARAQGWPPSLDDEET